MDNYIYMDKVSFGLASFLHTSHFISWILRVFKDIGPDY